MYPTAETAAVPVLDLERPDFAITGDEVRMAREKNWYAKTNYGIAVLRYAEVSRLMKHPKLRQGSLAWPAHNGVIGGPLATWWASWILNKEGEEHHRLRRLMNPAFSPKLIGPLAPRFQALADELIDGFKRPDHCEFVSEFAEPYAARVIAIMLGLPESEWKIIAAEASVLGLSLSVAIRDELPRIEAALDRLYQYADELIADRHKHPKDDFVTKFVSHTRESDKLSDREARDGLVLLIFGGYDTTHHQLGLAMQTFMSHLDQWRLLAEQPELGRAAVEEVMRVNPTVRWVSREALETFEYNGLQIDKGTTVHLFSQAAGTDPRVFWPPVFDITAKRKPHYGFGGGAHHCLGHFVARSDMSEALPQLARRMRDPKPAPGSSWLPDSGNTGPLTLPIDFTPGS